MQDTLYVIQVDVTMYSFSFLQENKRHAYHLGIGYLHFVIIGVWG